MTERVEIRLAREGEYDRVADILATAYAPSGLRPGDDYYQHLRDVAGRVAAAEVWVAVEGSEVLGTVTWPPVGSPEREVAGDDEAEFRMLAVDPRVQGLGIGRALVEAIVRRARSEGFRRIVLSTTTWSTSARRLYADMGFVRVPERDWPVNDDLVLQAYALEL
ncbi:MAG: GNAT family N-acetyltransferase [Intrasporangium sp.]|uniref:GNAT family N-acetyltransferase n=1 Tax=Intrasporangium sp. TaxID=1925024 RepID=UPI002649373C|nr:GNAT family N-acetyltransferase [Intrasporangium sp.]MDN5798236.1 GNAT family N-acetyltransferase [Intrasporangium sp.]